LGYRRHRDTIAGCVTSSPDAEVMYMTFRCMRIRVKLMLMKAIGNGKVVKVRKSLDLTHQEVIYRTHDLVERPPAHEIHTWLVVV
jgi:hypothetical protein